MPTKSLLAACVLLLAGGIALVWLPGDAATPPATQATAGAPAALPEAIEAVATARNLVAEPDRSARPLPADAEPLTITVVDGETKALVPAATVRWFDESWSDYLGHVSLSDSFLLKDDPERLADVAGWSTSTDAAGRAGITIASDTTVLVEADGRHGRLLVREHSVAPAVGHTVELEHDRVLRVRVLDDGGRPAGGVIVSIRDDDAPALDGRIARTSEVDGIATFRHLQLLARRADVPEWTAKPALVRPPDGCSATFSLDAPPAEPLVLRLPPCGTVRARAEFRGEQVPGIRELTLAHTERYTVHQTAAPVDPDGWARFRHVPLGLELEAGAYWLGSTRLAGPRNAGDDVAVRVTPDAERVVWTGRVLARDHTPVADERVTVRIECESRRATQQPTHTDANGRFVIALMRHRDGQRAERISFDWQRRGEHASRAEAAPRTMRNGVEDLGDVAATTLPLLVGGRIRGLDARALRRVTLGVQRYAVALADEDLWTEVGDQLVDVDADGAFTIRGATQPGRHCLAVGGDVQPIPAIEFELGRDDLSIDLDTGHDLAAGVLLPRDVPEQHIVVELVPPASVQLDPRRRERLVAMPQLQRGERYDVRWTAIPRGSYTLEVRAWAASGPTLRIPAVPVPGPFGGDPRLADVDLRPLVRATTVRIVDADGEPLAQPRGVVFPGAQPPAGAWQGYEVNGAESTLVLPPGPCDLLVCCTGRRPQRVRGAAGEQLTVRMDPWPDVTLTFAGMPSLPDGVSADVLPTPLAPIAGSYETPAGTHDLESMFEPWQGRPSIENGNAVVWLGDGAHRLEVRVARGDRSCSIAVGDPSSIVATTEHVVVRIPSEVWRRAIDAVTAPPK